MNRRDFITLSFLTPKPEVPMDTSPTELQELKEDELLKEGFKKAYDFTPSGKGPSVDWDDDWNDIPF